MRCPAKLFFHVRTRCDEPQSTTANWWPRYVQCCAVENVHIFGIDDGAFHIGITGPNPYVGFGGVCRSLGATPSRLSYNLVSLGQFGTGWEVRSFYVLTA